jgi:hypothetical protein
LRRFLDRAEELSRGLSPLRKEIALVYRQVGDFESTAPRPQIADKTQAAASYRRAATVAASIRSTEPSWADQQLSELGGRLQELGAPLNVSLEPARAPSPPPLRETIASPPPPKMAASRTPPEVTAAGADSEEHAELMQRLKTTTENAGRARRNLEALRDTLMGRGQAIRPDLLTSMALIDSLLEDATRSLDSNDLTTAEDSLRRAGYELRKVFQAVGG